ncbi:hypothetical protein [Pseudoduganella umbonata]|uniref:Uncharacterized protein n=1 Tax=Pseudoduganella umbonata TaxID=864828 RepID=A0A4P8HQA9_9BURK|nr:hypothetical protein [Pseudoduganella umbonata]MBB3220527.1 hypothetical protein [Pseudoduganella umbonata]QCP11959.1 hypothetical protein FCL38_17210 [Pseudoduganella umbonata]
MSKYEGICRRKDTIRAAIVHAAVHWISPAAGIERADLLMLREGIPADVRERVLLGSLENRRRRPACLAMPERESTDRQSG